MRLIDADPFGVIFLQGKSEDFIEGALFILDKIYEAPTVEERPSGEWVWKLDEETGESGWNCPVCNEFGDCKSPYCPNCGADMRKEGGEK